jgi:hypothetical protein
MNTDPSVLPACTVPYLTEDPSPNTCMYRIMTSQPPIPELFSTYPTHPYFFFLLRSSDPPNSHQRRRIPLCSVVEPISTGLCPLRPPGSRRVLRRRTGPQCSYESYQLTKHTWSSFRADRSPAKARRIKSTSPDTDTRLSSPICPTIVRLRQATRGSTASERPFILSSIALYTCP